MCKNSGNYVKAEKGGGHYDCKIWQRGRSIGEIGLVWFGLCCLMTPGLSKDIRCHV